MPKADYIWGFFYFCIYIYMKYCCTLQSELSTASAAWNNCKPNIKITVSLPFFNVSYEFETSRILFNKSHRHLSGEENSDILERSETAMNVNDLTLVELTRVMLVHSLSCHVSPATHMLTPWLTSGMRQLTFQARKLMPKLDLPHTLVFPW